MYFPKKILTMLSKKYHNFYLHLLCSYLIDLKCIFESSKVLNLQSNFGKYLIDYPFIANYSFYFSKIELGKFLSFLFSKIKNTSAKVDLEYILSLIKNLQSWIISKLLRLNH